MSLTLPGPNALTPQIVNHVSASAALNGLHSEFRQLSASDVNRDAWELMSCYSSANRPGGFVDAFLDDVLASPKGGGWPRSALGRLTIECAEELQRLQLPDGARFWSCKRDGYEAQEAGAAASRLQVALPSLRPAIRDVLVASASVCARAVHVQTGACLRCYRGFRSGRFSQEAVYPQRALSAWTTDKDIALGFAGPSRAVMVVDAPAELVWILPGYGEGELVLGLTPPTLSASAPIPQYQWLS